MTKPSWFSDLQPERKVLAARVSLVLIACGLFARREDAHVTRSARGNFYSRGTGDDTREFAPVWWTPRNWGRK